MPTGAYDQVHAASSGNGELTINTSASNSGNKRRRTADTNTNINNLTHLPSDQLVNIADYLSKTSRALFAVALTAPSSSFRKMGWRVEHSALHAASRAIISSSMAKPTRRGICYNMQVMEDYYTAGWEHLDLPFDIDANFAAKITDDDIGAVLVCVDGKSNLKKLRLAYCRKIVGHCLEPLRGSVVLEEFNASNIYFQTWGNQNQPSLSESAAVPILESIIDTDGNNLRTVSLPSKWRTGESRNMPPLSEFFTKFNALMLNEQVKCVCCSELCEGNNENSCQVCCSRMCEDCVEADVWEEGPFIRSCDQCSTKLCESCGQHRTCRECDSVYCSVCAKFDGVDAGQYCECDTCHKESLCLGCRVTEEHDDCWGCKDLLYPKLLGEKGVLAEENGRLAEENDELHKEIDRLDKENEQLYKEKEQLRKEIEELGEKEKDTFSRLAE